jgi:hypothetical protein
VVEEQQDNPIKIVSEQIKAPNMNAFPHGVHPCMAASSWREAAARAVQAVVERDMLGASRREKDGASHRDTHAEGPRQPQLASAAPPSPHLHCAPSPDARDLSCLPADRCWSPGSVRWIDPS